MDILLSVDCAKFGVTLRKQLIPHQQAGVAICAARLFGKGMVSGY